MKWLEAGIKVMPVVPSTGVAKALSAAAPALVAEGGESGRRGFDDYDACPCLRRR